MNHISDASKMVSDTPRTTDRVVFIDGNPWVNAPFAVSLELELKAANEQIKRLEEAGDKMASAWDKEWLTDTDIEAIIDYWHGAKEAKP